MGRTEKEEDGRKKRLTCGPIIKGKIDYSQQIFLHLELEN
jgi:hypothetical protein